MNISGGISSSGSAFGSGAASGSDGTAQLRNRMQKLQKERDEHVGNIGQLDQYPPGSPERKAMAQMHDAKTQQLDAELSALRQKKQAMDNRRSEKTDQSGQPHSEKTGESKDSEKLEYTRTTVTIPNPRKEKDADEAAAADQNPLEAYLGKQVDLFA